MPALRGCVPEPRRGEIGLRASGVRAADVYSDSRVGRIIPPGLHDAPAGRGAGVKSAPLHVGDPRREPRSLLDRGRILDGTRQIGATQDPVNLAAVTIERGRDMDPVGDDVDLPAYRAPFRDMRRVAGGRLDEHRF